MQAVVHSAVRLASHHPVVLDGAEPYLALFTQVVLNAELAACDGA